MCGICGIVMTDVSLINQQRINSMNNALIHRGPDSEGFYSEPGVALAMRRLKIIDLKSGDQPMTNEDQSIWIIYNGEIYNFLELRKQLEKKGHKFRSHSDTECILHGYEQYGLKVLDHLRGMFAMAVWDKKQKRLFLARDRLGKKPLYYTQQAGKFIFSSELPSLLSGIDQKPGIDLNAINLFLSLQYIPDPHTPYTGIYRLPAAHYLIWQDGITRIEKYWDFAYEPKHNGNENELIEELRSKVREAVQMRMISEVPLGAHLSGGIDSSIIVSEMAACSPSPLKTFTIGFQEETFSELPFAREVAKQYGTDHHEFILEFGDIPKIMKDILTLLGEPLADPSVIPMFYLARMTRQYVTVALNGDGGDECFAGYQRYWLDPWANAYCKLPAIISKRLIPYVADLFPDRSTRPIGADLINGLKRLGSLANMDTRASFLRWGSYFSPDMLAELWNSEQIRTMNIYQPLELLTQTFDRANAHTYLDRTLYTDTHTYLPGDLLVKADRLNMAHSLEGRSPFLDQELVAWSARLPKKMKTKGLSGKAILRKAYQHVFPKIVSQRGKQGFGIPINRWFRGPLNTWLHNNLLDNTGLLNDWFQRKKIETLIKEHSAGKQDHSKRLWALIVLSVWSSIQ